MINEDYTAVNFLIVDDDEVCVMGIKRAMKNLNLINPTFIAEDGIQALEILNGKLDSSNRLPPFIVTLDLNMPRMDGFEFLSVIRDNEIYRKLVIFVLTTSDAPDDVAAAYSKNIAGYIVKEDLEEMLADALRLINDYANLVVLPR